ncbi:4877_t:CDS:2 [Scutellospora calospora]|uniref:4877_t:CDS:1 n=1 Tax=Scutellospora calospora TaxID=85575 RepID=A0ACA9LQP5_9GLOM|nr:4877_t:CDS:2 [Scutellospora calospora]
MSQLIASKGLTGMYADLLDFSNEHIYEANLPILIHCQHGKDRTGLIVALVLSICGVDVETIAQDYASSQKGLASIYSSIVDDLKKIGLTEEFAIVHPDATSKKQKNKQISKKENIIKEFQTLVKEQTMSIIEAINY